MKLNPFALILTFAVGGLAGSWASFYYLDTKPVAQAVEDVVENKSLPAEGEAAERLVLDASEAALEEPEVRLSFSEKIDLARSHDSYRKQQYELEQLFEGLTAEEAQGVLTDILEVKEPQLRGSLLRPFFVKWGELDGPLAYATAVELKGRDRNDGISASLAGWSHTDVHAAWKEALPIVEESSMMFARQARGAVAEMAKQDPDVLLALLAEDSSNQKYSSFGYSLIDEAFKSNQQSELLTKLSVIENAEDRNKLVSQLFQRWGILDTEAPLDALAAISDPIEAKSALEGFMRGWAESEPEGALNYAFENREDPAIKASFASMLQTSFRNGSRADNEVLISRLEEQGLLSELAPQIAPQLAFMQPEVALRVADSIEDSKERTQQRQRALSGLARVDIDRARDYLDGLGSVEEKAELLPSMSWALTTRSDGGTQLVSLMESIPQGAERTKVIESLLMFAGRPQARLSDGYREGLALMARDESGLSENAKTFLSQLSEPNP